MVFKNGMMLSIFANKTLILTYFLQKRRHKRKSFSHKKIVSEISHIKSYKWSLKLALASS